MALNSKETLHSFVNKGIVVKSWFLLICFSDVSEYKVVQGPDKEFNFNVDEMQELPNAENGNKASKESTPASKQDDEDNDEDDDDLDIDDI